MLDPRDRRLLLEALRPPVGRVFDRAIGTTFSLDPTALLAVPLACAAFDIGDERRAPHDDSLALLEAVRRNADRVSLFCEAGRIAIPAKYRALLTYLEKSVVEVTAPTEGFVFHPKVWLIRYVRSDDSVTYRLLCLTRNLTFDRSWDTLLSLDGELTARTNAFAVNHPLGDFVAALPSLAVRDVPSHVVADVELLQREVRRVRFEPPPGFEEYAFIPLGHTGRKRGIPFPATASRGLVVSPFVSPQLLPLLPRADQGVTLVSRGESLDELDSAVLEPVSAAYVLANIAVPEVCDTDPPETGGMPSAVHSTSELTGLHAKLYVFDQGWRTRVWTGSANATYAAFHGNVEFVVELAGMRSACGIEKILGEPGQDGLLDLLEPYAPGEHSPISETERELEARLEGVRRAVARLSLHLLVEESEGSAWHVVLVTDHKHPDALAEDVVVKAWPISLCRDRAKSCTWVADPVARFDDVSIEALTPFTAFEACTTIGGQSASIVFVLNLPLVGEPAGRGALVLQQMLKSSADLMALLMLLLAEDESGFVDALAHANEHEAWSFLNGTGSQGLLESLVRALAHSPSKLQSVKRLVDDVQRAGYDGDVIPPGFMQIWPPVWEAAQERLGAAAGTQVD